MIRDIRRANIKIWMLTGDKLETAENISKSCGLVSIDNQIIRVREKEKVEERLREIEEIVAVSAQQQREMSLIVDGECLALIMHNPQWQTHFETLAWAMKSVVVCRSTPKQKAQVIRMVKLHRTLTTLAIGDGSNDVNMIQASDIGIGIYGNEGLRAAQSSDFAIG